MRALAHKMVDASSAFDHPVTIGIVAGSAVVLAVVPVIIGVLRRRGQLDTDVAGVLHANWRTWVLLAPLMMVPVLLGPGCAMLAVCALSLLCYREFARATGLFRQRLISIPVVLGVLGLTFAELDHWYGLFVAVQTLTIAIIAMLALLPDQPAGYLQRVALGALCFELFGVCLGHLGYMANDPDFRPIILCTLLCVEMNDVFAFFAGKLVGRRRLAPNTSPNKTIGGALGALLLTTALFAGLGHFVFRGGVLDSPVHLIALGLLISFAGQIGDLVMSSVKRDLRIKDLGVVLPGHGGLLDRFDSLLLVAPAVFHYVGYFRGFGLDQPVRIITGP